MYTAPEYMVPPHVWEKHPESPYNYGSVLRSPQDARININGVPYNIEGLLSIHFVMQEISWWSDFDNIFFFALWAVHLELLVNLQLFNYADSKLDGDLVCV